MWLKFFLNCCALLPLVPAIVFTYTHDRAYLDLLKVLHREPSDHYELQYSEKVYSATTTRLSRLVLTGVVCSCLLFTLVHFLLP